MRTGSVRRPRPIPGVRLHAVLATWNEADVVGATVGNALEQGCEAVHLLDNGSDDGTDEVARAAGAHVLEVFRTDRYDGRANQRRINAAIEDLSRAAGAAQVWWLLLDADELVEGPDGTTIRGLIDRLDRSIRVVGSRTINHYPRAEHPIEAGADPRGFPTNAQERRGVSCRAGHWKHPLVRWDAAGPPVIPQRGAHVASSSRRLLEPPVSLVTHHYPYRNPEVTRERLARLSARLDGEPWAMGRRAANADAVYREAYAEVDAHDMVGPGEVLAPRPRPAVRTRPA